MKYVLKYSFDVSNGDFLDLMQIWDEKPSAEEVSEWIIFNNLHGFKNLSKEKIFEEVDKMLTRGFWTREVPGDLAYKELEFISLERSPYYSV